ncbi:MAG: hypothetical protein ACJ780_19415 [Solirubrobacteraceae bacterium]
MFTRTRAETDGWPLVVLEGRDRPDAVIVPTAELADAVRGFLGDVGRDAAGLR